MGRFANSNDNNNDDGLGGPHGNAPFWEEPELDENGLATFEDPVTGVTFKYDPNSDVPTNVAVAQGASRQAAAQAGVSTRTWNSYWRNQRAGGGSGGGGGRGGGSGGGRAPTFGIGGLESRSIEELKERLINYYKSWTGVLPAAPSLEWVTGKALGGKASYDIQKDIQATPEFKTRFKAMPAGMEVDEYDRALVSASSLAFDVAGRKPREDELALMFAGDGDGFYNSLKEG